MHVPAPEPVPADLRPEHLKAIPTIRAIGHVPALAAASSDALKFIGVMSKQAERAGAPIVGLSKAIGHHHVPGLRQFIGFQRMAATNDPEMVDEMLTGPNARNFGRAFDLKVVVSRVLNEGLITSDGVSHDTRKRAYQPMFGAKALGRYFEVIQKETKKLVDGWETRANQNLPIEIERDLIALSLSASFASFFSTSVPKDRVHEIADAMGILMAHSQKQAQPPGNMTTLFARGANQRYEAAIADIRTMLDEIIAERRKSPEPRGDLLDAFFDAEVQLTDEGAPGPLTDAQIRDEMFTFLFAGHDTTALAIKNALQELAAHPDVQAAVAEEVSDVGLGSNLDFKKDVPALKLTNAVFKEALRLHPTAPWGAREAQCDTQLGEYFIPKGTTVAFSALHLNRRTAEWGQDAESFDPQRFLDGRPIPKDFNFNAGRTKCIGFRFAELMGAAVLSEAVGRLDFRHVTDEPPEVEHTITLVSKKPLVLAATPRSGPEPTTGALISDPQYAEVLQKAQPNLNVDTRAGVTTFTTGLKLRRGLRPWSFSWIAAGGLAPKTVFVGPPFEPYERTEVLTGIDDPGPLIRRLEEQAKKSRAKLIAVPNVAKDCPAIGRFREAGFTEIPTAPDMVLSLDGAETIDDLRARVGSNKGGRWMRKVLEDFDTKGHTLERVDSFAGVLDEVYACYRNQADKATLKFFDYGRDYFASIHEAGDVDLFLARDKDGAVSGFTIGMMNGDRYEWGRVGVTEAYDRKDSVYFRLMLCAAEQAMARGAKTLSLGPTSYGVKAKLGAEPKEMVVLAKARGPILSAMIRTAGKTT